MEPHKDPISVRIARINSEILQSSNKASLLDRESLLDVLFALYEECCVENIQKYDANVAKFVEKYKDSVREIKKLRVNITDFEIKSVIGRGHFGEVHLVKEKQTGDVYAMKTIRKGDNEFRVSFEEERNIMAFTESNWLTKLQYSFQDSMYLVYIMEYHPGGDLLGLLYRQGGTLPESAATFYLSELVLALDDLHTMGYVHRDIKPDNILLDRCGHIKLADFGSAAKLGSEGFISVGPPVGTPDYVAPEVLQCLEGDTSKSYGVSCDFWSLGVLAYELTIGNTPFSGQNSTSIYSKIINHASNLKFPPDLIVSQSYIDFIRNLVTDARNRLNMQQIKNHSLFKNVVFDHLREQIPPYVPKINSIEDTSNFNDVGAKKKNINMDSFKKRDKFSGRNLKYVGFTFTHNFDVLERTFDRRLSLKDEVVIDGYKKEIDSLKCDFNKEKESLENKLIEKTVKLENAESLRDKLERELANVMAENSALKRTLELERKDRTELEKKALDMIKSAKLKWESTEKSKTESLNLEIEQQRIKITELLATNKILNEQLECALKLESKQKQSMNNIESLSRRSVIGLESRLDKVTIESQSIINNLQKQISEEINKRSLIENELKSSKNKETSLLEKLKSSEKEFDYWKSKIDEAESQVRLLNEQVNRLEGELERIDDYKKEIDSLRDKLDRERRNTKNLENKNVVLLKNTECMDEYKKELEDMKKTVAKMQNDRKVKELEEHLMEEREKCLSLMKQLKESENVLTENQELKELRTKFWRVEKELGNAKIDKRILERELKEAQQEIKQLTEKIDNEEKIREQMRKNNEAALLELSSINENISLELMKMKDSYRNLQDKLENEKEKFDAEKSIMIDLKNIIKTKDEQINSITNELNAVTKLSNNLSVEVKNLDDDKNKLVKLVESLQKEKREILDDYNKTKRELDNTNLNLNALREACTLLENQVVEYEKIIVSFESKQNESKTNTEKLVKDLCEAKRETQEAKKSINEERSLKLFAESKAKRLEEDVECLVKERDDYKEQCVEYKKYSAGLNEELSVAEEKIGELEVTVKTYARQIDELRNEMKHLKHELSDYLTQLNRFKELNYKLKRQLGEEKEGNAGLRQHLSEIERVLNEKNCYYKERELKADATIKQQIKLIDYLQTKIDEHSNKKKTLTEVLFGSSKKENQPPVSLAMNYKDLENQLLKERQTNKNLHEEIYKLKAATMIHENDKISDKLLKLERHKSEILSPKSKAAIKQIVRSPSKQKNNDFFRQNSLNRMHHNIPHRYECKVNRSSCKCKGCSEPISLGRNVAVCSECNVHVHVDCKHKMPNTCGLPQVYAKHYTESLKQNEEKVTESNDGRNQVNDKMVEGWIKVPGKSNSWEKQYAILTDSSIKLYTCPPHEKSSSLIKEFTLKPENSHGKVVSEPIPSEIGIPVANSDLPFVLKVEVAPDTTCWPPECLIFLTLSAQDKDKWFLALQKIYYDDMDRSKCDLVFKIDDNIKLNQLTDLTENIKVLGSESGLYSYHDNNLVHIEGIDTVHQISIMSTINKVLMIVGANRHLISCDLNHLINLAQCAQFTKPKLKYDCVRVSNLNGFHILQVSHFGKHQKICVATERQLVILNYDSDNSEFVPVKMLDTAEPTGCALFTENSLIVGADKFFEIDLCTFTAEEFLDASDSRLKPAESCYKIKSFPLSVLQVSKNPKEYLLCFNEFSVFVDEWGRSSRDQELKHQHMPLVFHFAKPFLYIRQFSAVEIWKIGDPDDKLDSVRVELGKFEYLGGNKRGVYVVLGDDVKFVDGRKLLEVEESCLESESSDESGDRFTFSSSIVQSLDGNLSDDSEDKHKKVRFEQTDF